MGSEMCIRDRRKAGHYQLVRIQDYYQLLQYLEQHDLTIQDKIEVVALDDFSQTVTIQYKDKELAVPFAIAQQLYVEAV